MTRMFLYRVALAALIAAAISMVIALRPAAAATLIADVEVDGEIVTLGDLFDGAGDLGNQPVFRAPDLGVEGELPATAAIAAATAAGLEVEPSSLVAVRVVRRSIMVDAAAYERLLTSAVALRLGADPEDVVVTLEGTIPTVAADGAAVEPATLGSLQVATDGGRFVATVAVDVGSTTKTVSLRGVAVETAEVPVLVRPIARREVVGPGDIVMERVDRRRIARNALTHPAAVVGMAARRPLRAGATVAVADVEQPRVVLRGELVTIIYQKPGLMLSARGRALGDAAIGETVNVLNEQSRRTVQGIATAAGTVQIEPAGATTLAAAATAPVRTQ